MPYVSFITDNKFQEIVNKFLKIGDEAKISANQEFNRNVIDPFSMLMEMACNNMNLDNWIRSEKNRQIQKTLTNEIGVLHQSILGSVKDWVDLSVGGGVDLVNEKRKIIAEIKNKHNTVTGGKRVDNYKELEDLVMRKASKYKDYTAYFVEILPKSPRGYEKPFTPPNKATGIKCPSNPKILQIDGKSFYKLVTGVDDALEQVFKALPKVINDCRNEITINISEEAESFFKSAYVPKPPKISNRKSPKASK